MKMLDRGEVPDSKAAGVANRAPDTPTTSRTEAGYAETKHLTFFVRLLLAVVSILGSAGTSFARAMNQVASRVTKSSADITREASIGAGASQHSPRGNGIATANGRAESSGIALVDRPLAQVDSKNAKEMLGDVIYVNFRRSGPVRDFDADLSCIAAELIPDVYAVVDEVALPALLG
jgi:hypothetical protein